MQQPNINLEIKAITDKGGRDYNQDALNHRPYLNRGGCFMLADGLGGQGGGEKASAIAVSQVTRKTLAIPENLSINDLSEVFETAHQAVQNAQQKNSETQHMASTLVVLKILDSQAIWGHAGDSRLYCFRAGKIIAQTKDHSVPQMLVGSGEITMDEIRGHPDRNRLLRALGDQRKTLKARMVKQPLDLQSGDVFLLCSDGFWEWVTEDEMQNTLNVSETIEEWLDLLEQRIHQIADTQYDNYSALAVRYTRDDSISVEMKKTDKTVRAKKTVVSFWKQLKIFFIKTNSR